MDAPSTRPISTSIFTALVAAAITMAVLGLQALGSPLYWWHVAVGEMIATWQRIPDQQLFLYTVPYDEPAVHTSWLGSVILANLHDLAGPELNLLLRNVLCALSVALVTFFVARRTDRLLPTVAPLIIFGGACFFFAHTGPAVLALPLATIALIAVFALLERPQRVWLAAVAPLMALLIINVDMSTALVVIVASLAASFHLTRLAISDDDGRRLFVAAGLSAAALPALFGFAYGPTFWGLAISSIELTALAPPSAALIALIAASLLTQKGRKIPGTAILVLTLLATSIAAILVQPGVPTRTPIVTSLHSDLRTQAPLAGVMSADLPLRCAEHLRRTGREVRLFHDPEHAGFLLYHLVDPSRPHAPLFDDHRGLVDEDTLEMAELIRTEPVARGFFTQFDVNAAVFDRHAYPTLTEELTTAPEWHDLAEGIDHFACFVPR